MSQVSKPTPQTDEEDVPKGIQLISVSPAFREDPYPILDKVMAHGPILADMEFGRYFVTGHDLVKELIRDRRLGVDPRKSLPDSYVRKLYAEDDTLIMLFQDDPDHKRLRRFVNQVFNAEQIEAMRAYTEETVDRLLGAMEGKSEVDIIREFADYFPMYVIAKMLGADVDQPERFKVLTADVLLNYDPFRSAEMEARYRAAWAALWEYFDGLITERRARPQDDMITKLIDARQGEDRLTQDEIILTCMLMLTAGNVTTTDLFGNGLLALLKHPDQLARLKADPGLIDNAIEEMLRIDGPITDTTRLPLEDIVVNGCPMEKGRTITLSLASVGHDPSVNPDPYRFDITRQNITHMAFGGGVHKCLGSPLARMEIAIALLKLLAAKKAESRG